MTWAEAGHTLRYLFRPLSTHVHILLVFCLLVALGLGTLQNDSPGQSRQQAEQTQGTTQLSTSPLSGQQTGSSNVQGSNSNNGSSSPHKPHSQSQQNTNQPTTPPAGPIATTTTPETSTTSPPANCDSNCSNSCTGTGDCPNSTPSVTSTPASSPSIVSCDSCNLPTGHYHLHHFCPLSCQSMSP
jgi:hypothetical protein